MTGRTQSLPVFLFMVDNMLSLNLADIYRACQESLGRPGYDGILREARKDAVLDAFAHIEQAAMEKAIRTGRNRCTTSRTRRSRSRA